MVKCTAMHRPSSQQPNICPCVSYQYMPNPQAAIIKMVSIGGVSISIAASNPWYDEDRSHEEERVEAIQDASNCSYTFACVGLTLRGDSSDLITATHIKVRSSNKTDWNPKPEVKLAAFPGMAKKRVSGLSTDKPIKTMACNRRRNDQTTDLSGEGSLAICSASRVNVRSRSEGTDVSLFRLKNRNKQMIESPAIPKNAEEMCDHLNIYKKHEIECAEMLVENDISENIIKILKAESRLHIEDVQEMSLQKWGITVMKAHRNLDQSAIARLAYKCHRKVPQMIKIEKPGRTSATMRSEVVPEAPKTSKSRREFMRELVDYQVENAKDLISRFGKSSRIWMSMHNPVEPITDLEIHVTVTQGNLQGPTIGGHIRVLRKFEAWCVQRDRDPWRSSTGEGPRLYDINAYAEHLFNDLLERNADLPQEDRTGKTVINCIPRAFKYGRDSLGLSIPSELTFISGLGARSLELFGNLAKPADPYSWNVIVYLERMVLGHYKQPTVPDRFFAGSVLLAIFTAKRFGGDIQKIPMKQVIILASNQAATGWGTKMRADLDMPKWFKVDPKLCIEQPWLVKWINMSPPVDEKRDFVCPAPSEDYKGWAAPMQHLEMGKAEKWFTRLLSLSCARTVVPEEERRKWAKNPRLHGVKHTLPTLLAEIGYGDLDIQEITGHESIKYVRHYSRKANTRQGHMRNDAMEYVRIMGGFIHRQDQSMGTLRDDFLPSHEKEENVMVPKPVLNKKRKISKVEKSLGELNPIGDSLVKDIPQKRKIPFQTSQKEKEYDPYAIRPSFHDMILNPISELMKSGSTNRCPNTTSISADASMRSHPPVPRAIGNA
jgi:hypothetical protein